jgi:hypothetical protein
MLAQAALSMSGGTTAPSRPHHSIEFMVAMPGLEAVGASVAKAANTGRRLHYS